MLLETREVFGEGHHVPGSGVGDALGVGLSLVGGSLEGPSLRSFLCLSTAGLSPWPLLSQAEG